MSEENKAMQCPNCETPSLAFTKEIDVDHCKTCGGVWFDEKALMPLLREDPRALTPLWGGTDQEELNLKRSNCPRDATTMLRVYSATKNHPMRCEREKLTAPKRTISVPLPNRPLPTRVPRHQPTPRRPIAISPADKARAIVSLLTKYGHTGTISPTAKAAPITATAT